jgi:predicted DNA-binding transcriptional regulator YafY
LRQASDAALIKLLASLPAMHRRGAEFARQRIHIDAAGWHHVEEAVSALPLLLQAIWQERQLRFSYQRGEVLVERIGNPLGLVAKGSVWYLIAQVEDDIRVYRASRLQQVVITDQPYVRPPDFDLAAYWSQSSRDFKANIPRFSVIVRVAQEVAGHMHHPGRFIQAEPLAPPDEHGWVKIRLLFDVGEEACGYLLSFGTDLEILEPQELREQVIRLAEGIVAFYARSVS